LKRGVRPSAALSHRRAVAASRRLAPAAQELEVAEQRLDVGDVLSGLAARCDGEAHRLDGAGEVAAQLAQVGHPRISGERRLAVDGLLQRRDGRAVTAELDLCVDDHVERAHHLRGRATGREAVAQPEREVVAGEGERPGAGEAHGRTRVPAQRGGVSALRSVVVTEVAGLPDPLEEGAAERRVGGRVARARANRLLKRGDAG